jgi:Zn-dependent protease with chaperone function
VRARSQHAADRAVEGLYESVRANPDSATGPGAASVTASVLAWCVHLVTLAMLVVAIVLVALTPTHPVAVVGAALLLCAAWLTRPRPGTEPPDVQWVQSPPVLDLVRQVAQAAGAPVPHRVGFDERLNATYHVVGWRRERLLVIGMPLWEALPGQQRVALVAHELGHAAAKNSRHRFVVSSALAALREWMLVCHYESSPATAAERHSTQNAAAGLVQLSEMAARWILAVVGLVPAAVYSVLLAATQRQSQRAEYGADLAGAAVAGRQAMVAALSTVMEGDALMLAMRRTAMGSTDRDVLAAVRAEGQRLSADDWPSRRNRHRNGPFDSHPPDELRRGLVLTLAERPPTVVLDDTRAARIDAELAPVRAWATRRVYDSFQAH